MRLVKQEAERLQPEEATTWLAAIVSSSTDAIVGKTCDGVVTSFNPAAERLFGYCAEEIIGKPVRILIPPARQEEEDRILALIAAGERVKDYETSRLHKNGSPIEVSISVSPVRDASGRIIGAAKVARDITERKRTEEALRESEQRLRLAYQAANIGAFEWNMQTGVNTWTPELEKIYDLAPGEFGKTQPAWEQLVHPEDRANAVRLVQEALETGKPVETEWRTVWRDGSVHWVHRPFSSH
jgi:PAS domain S-box-containing protein